MLTKTDITELKQVFATKKDLERFTTKEDLNFAVKEIIDYIRDCFSPNEEKLIDHERRLNLLEHKIFPR